MKKRHVRAALVLVICLVLLLFTIELAQRIAVYDLAQAGASVTVTEGDLSFPSQRGTNIRATLTVPDQEGSLGLVVMCHGFTGNREGDGHFQPLAQTLAQNGIATIRLDFAGNGSSDEPFTAYTLTSMYDDIESAITYMKANYDIDDSRIGLLGHSMGGRVVTLHLSDSIAAAALWSPANNDGLDGLEFLDHTAEGREALRTAAAESEEQCVSLPNWGDTTISSAFIEEMAESRPWEVLRAYRGALLVSFAGGDEELLSQQTIDGTLEAAAAAHAAGADYTSLYGQFKTANHNYNGTLDGDPVEGIAIAANLEEQTARFFIQALEPAAEQEFQP